VTLFPIVRDAVEFGITAVNEAGNESEMIKLYAPFQFTVPDAPKNLIIEKIEDYHTYHRIEDRNDKIPPEVTLNDSGEGYLSFDYFKKNQSRVKSHKDLTELE
jgi:hypothetical protein